MEWATAHLSRSTAVGLEHFALIFEEFRRGRVHTLAFLTYVNRPSKRVNEDHPIILRGCEALDPLDVLVRVPF